MKGSRKRIAMIKSFLKRHWPRLRLHTILFSVMLFVSVLPLIGTIFFRVYETSLVQSTETELIMQGAVFASVYARAVEQAQIHGNRTVPGSPHMHRSPGLPASSPATALPPVSAAPGPGTSISAANGMATHARGSPAAPGRALRPGLRKSQSNKVTPRFRDGLRGEVFIGRPPRIDILTDKILPPRPQARIVSGVSDATALAAGRLIYPILLQATRTTLASVRIVDARGRVVAGRREFGRSLAHVREIKSALRGRVDSTLRRKPGYRSRYPVEIISRAASTRVFHAVPVFLHSKVVGAVLLSRSPKSVFILGYDNPGKVALSILAMLLVILAIAALLSRSITRPVALLVESTKKVARGDLSLPPPPPTAAMEIQELFGDIEVMARTIDQRSNYIKNFAAAVSHEFKTPLAGISGAVELLQEHDGDMSDRERKKFLENVSQDARRLERLVSKLLQLARADVLSPGDERVNLIELLKSVCSDFAGKDLAIKTTISTEPGQVAISSLALETALNVLLSNALQNGADQVEITVDKTGTQVEITLHDNGFGVAIEDRARIFTPFFTTRRQDGGTGLGLPIAQSLVTAYGGIIVLGQCTEGAVFHVQIQSAAI